MVSIVIYFCFLFMVSAVAGNVFFCFCVLLFVVLFLYLCYFLTVSIVVIFCVLMVSGCYRAAAVSPMETVNKTPGCFQDDL